jgi:hypothetical protein
MLLIYTPKITTRITYVFKHICTRILGIEIGFTSTIETFIAHEGEKLSYGRQALGSEMFLQSHGLLIQNGFDSIDVSCKDWGNTKGFFAVGEKSALPFDIFAASFYLLSRYEEYLPHVKDEEGRFPASESLAGKEDFLQTPIIDIWAYIFKQKLQEQFSNLDFPERNTLIHNLIEVKHPFLYKHKGFLYSFIGFVKDFFKLKLKTFFRRAKSVLGFKKDPNNVFSWIIENVKNTNNKITIFFLVGNAINFNEGINFQKQKFRLLIKYVADYVNVGQIFSSTSIPSLEALKKEKEQLESITNRNLNCATNSKNWVNLPDFYRMLIELEVQTDFTMYYKNVAGFRAGTCTPFLFYDLDYEIKTPLIIHPIAMATYNFNEEESLNSLQVLLKIVEDVKKVKGIISIFFSNTNFRDLKKNKILKTLFSQKLQIYGK